MVELARWSPVTVFTVFDGNGRQIGEVVRPKAAPVVGLGAGTVLLVRAESGGQSRSPGGSLLPA